MKFAMTSGCSYFDEFLVNKKFFARVIKDKKAVQQNFSYFKSRVLYKFNLLNLSQHISERRLELLIKLVILMETWVKLFPCSIRNISSVLPEPLEPTIDKNILSYVSITLFIIFCLAKYNQLS